DPGRSPKPGSGRRKSKPAFSGGRHLRGALRMAKRGWRVFPLYHPVDGGCSCGNPDCSSFAKHPLIGDWGNAASSDPDVIRAWWADHPEANVATATGNGLYVLDIDGPKGR